MFQNLPDDLFNTGTPTVLQPDGTPQAEKRKIEREDDEDDDNAKLPRSITKLRFLKILIYN